MSKTLTLKTKSGILLLLLAIGVGFLTVEEARAEADTSSLGSYWKSIKSELSSAEKAETLDESLSHLNSAKSIYNDNFKSAALQVDSESNDLIEAAFVDTETRLSDSDISQAKLNRQVIDKTIYKIAFMKMELAISENNSDDFQSWYSVMDKKFKISEKDYTSNSLIAEIVSDSSVLSINGEEITQELLGIFKQKVIEELEEAIAALDEGNDSAAKKFTYEGLYYYRTLHPAISEKLGTSSANELLHKMTEAVEVTMSGESIDDKKSKLIHIASEVELIIREYEGGDTSEIGLALSGIKDRLNLVDAEYLDAVNNGEIINQVEYDETIIFLTKATEIFNENKDGLSLLSTFHTDIVQNNLYEIDELVTSLDNPSKVTTIVEKSIDSITSLQEFAGGAVVIDTLLYIDEIERLLNEAKTAYHSGDTQGAFSLVTTAYLDNYEFVEGPLGEVDPELMEKIEVDMRENLRSMIKSGASTDDVDTQIDMILSDLSVAKTVVPEFGSIAILILVAAIIGSVLFARKSNLLKFPTI
jgi:predicted secreted protein with PEFG-CTERM motif